MNITIQEPWWGAYEKFGWAKGIWGVSVAKNKIEKAIKNKEKIYLNIWKFKTKYEVSPIIIKNYAQKNKTQNLARGNSKVILYCIPQTLLNNEAGK